MYAWASLLSVCYRQGRLWEYVGLLYGSVLKSFSVEHLVAILVGVGVIIAAARLMLDALLWDANLGGALRTPCLPYLRVLKCTGACQHTVWKFFENCAGAHSANGQLRKANGSKHRSGHTY